MRQRILVQLPSFGSGGAENYALRLIRYAGTEAYEWHVTSGNLSNAVLDDAFREVGAEVHNASPGYGHPLQIYSFQQFLRLHDFVAVMTLTGTFGGLALSIARLVGVPRRIGWHRRSTPAYVESFERRLYARGARAMLDWGATRILSNSRIALENHHGPAWLQSAKFGVIRNGVDSVRFRPRPELKAELRTKLGIPEDAIVIGHIGRLDPAKDHDTLLAVTAQLVQTRPKLRLLLVGAGTDSAAFAGKVERAGVTDKVLRLGTREDVELLYNAMDVFLFPSVTEGQPNALIEAMLSGVAIIASDIPGVREAIPPNFSENLFSPRDVAAASALVESALADPEAATVSIEWARERYQLERNLDLALCELAPPNAATAHA